MKNLIIPDNIDYDQFSGLSNEVGQNSRKSGLKLWVGIRNDGITPAAVYILLSHIRKSLVSIYGNG